MRLRDGGLEAIFIGYVSDGIHYAVRSYPGVGALDRYGLVLSAFVDQLACLVAAGTVALFEAEK